MSMELIAILVSFGIGALGLFTKTRQGDKSETLNAVGWLSLCLILASGIIGVYLTADKQRQLQAEKVKTLEFQEQVRHLQVDLAAANGTAKMMEQTASRLTANTLRLTAERDALSKQVEEFKGVVKNYQEAADVPHRIDAKIGNEEWIGDTITLKLGWTLKSGDLTDLGVTKNFNGRPFKGRNVVVKVTVVNVRPEDMKRITFGGIYLQGFGYWRRCGPFVHGDQITLTTNQDDGDYAVLVNEKDEPVMAEVLRRNPDAGIQLQLVQDVR